jgi:catechol 1,2-dioxygenase
MSSDRRAFLKWMTASGAAAAGLLPGYGSGSGAGPGAAGDGGSGGGDGGGPGCRPTTPDVLGPFYEPGAPMRIRIAGDEEPGERLELEGVVVEADCVTPIEGALVDVWQADRDGDYHGAGDDYRLRGRLLTGEDGEYRIESIRPGNYEVVPGLWRPAHLHFTVTREGFVSVTTQLYFTGDPFLPPNDGCPGCGSDDPDRIIDLAGDADSGWRGEFRIVLARAR